MTDKPIDTTNLFAVGVVGGGVRSDARVAIMGLGMLAAKQNAEGGLARADALNLAAWIVVLAAGEGEFEAVLEAIKRT